MRIARIYISNFRNFEEIDIDIGVDAVIVGENKIGKSNLLYALRLVLDPSLPDSARRLRQEDFWDGLERPLDKDDRIIIAADLADFEEDKSQLAILAEHLVQAEPMVARLTYVWQPIAGLTGDPKKDADYEFLVYGGDRPENRISYDVRRRLPLELMPALRDCAADLARWGRSPLRPLLDKAAGAIDRKKLVKIAENIDKSTESLTEIDEVKRVSDSIGNKLIEIVGPSQSLETILRFAPTDSDKLIRALRVFIDGGKRGITEASLGSTNLLYFVLKILENEQLVDDGERDHTFLAIEEPEAHLHPSLQRLIFRNYLKLRGQEEKFESSSTILMTTHSPHIASVTPLRDFVVLRQSEDGDSTEAVSTTNIKLDDSEVDDLERYIDATRGELLFARRVILVEGDAERYLIPILAKKQGYDLDELGISVCSISGNNFYPYLMLIGPNCLNMPFAALTDYDPVISKKDGNEKEPLGHNRVVNQMMSAILEKKTWDAKTFDQILKMAPKTGIFINSHTFEVDLINSGLAPQFAEVMEKLATSAPMRDRMKEWASDVGTLDTDKFLSDLEIVGKGRFAQRLAGIVAVSKTAACPKYIVEGVKHVASKCRRS